MAKLHAKLQGFVKSLFEEHGYFVIENKKGKSSKYYNSGRKGIADLLAVRPYSNIIWLEIKTENDVQKKDQIAFQEEVRKINHKYYVIYDISDCETILRLNK